MIDWLDYEAWRKYGNPIRRRFAACFMIMIPLLLSCSCATVPLTNRRQVLLVPSQQMTALSQTEYNKVLDSQKVVTTGPELAQIRRVGERIAGAVAVLCSEQRFGCDFNWEFNLIADDSQVNAWAMPGGKVAFYTGILKFTQGDAGVAAVMGHEIAHALAKHGNERMSHQLMAQFGTAMLDEALASKPAATRGLFMTAAGLGTTYGVLLPFSRQHESEADLIGLKLMAMAGYDPREAVAFWQRMEAGSTTNVPEFLSTHPSGKRRIADLNSHLPAALEYYRAR